MPNYPALGCILWRCVLLRDGLCKKSATDVRAILITNEEMAFTGELTWTLTDLNLSALWVVSIGVVLMVGGSIPGHTRVLSTTIFEHVEIGKYAQAHASLPSC